MSRRRPEGFELARAVLEPGFTPREHDVVGLAALLDAEDTRVAKAVTRALARTSIEVAPALAAQQGSETARSLVCRVAGQRLDAGRELEAMRGLVERGLEDPSAKVRRAAVGALAKDPHPNTRTRLAGLAKTERAPSVAEAIAVALGKLGASEELAALAPEHATGSQAWDRARLLARRSGPRAAATISVDAPLGTPLELGLRCRVGLEPILVDELGRLGVDALGYPRSGRVKARLGAGDSLSRVLEARTAIDVSIVARRARATGQTDAELVLACLTAPEVERLVAQLTRGPARLRLEWLGAGKRRSLTWEVATSLERRGSVWVNDPTESLWEARIALGDDGARIDLCPRLEDTRFAYRVADVPAASHPTIAAAIAALGGAAPGDVVWDPFVGSGLELCERARLGGYALLLGHDTDPAALDRARSNLEALGAAPFDLVLGDAREASLPELSLVLTNPPMGRRVRGDVGLDQLLPDVLRRAASRLRSGGRVVLASPRPRATLAAARGAGLVATHGFRVDLGGFDVELQRFERA